MSDSTAVSTSPAPTSFVRPSSPDTATTPDRTTSTPRARRGAAAVFAQYIQDLTHPSPSDACAAAA